MFAPSLRRLWLGFLVCTGAALADSKPNILFIFLDDFGWKDTSYMGSDFFETPHIDKIVAEGMAFTQAYSASANCAPARASLLSGQYTPRHKIYNVGTTPRGKAEHRRLEHIPGVTVLDPAIKTWAQIAQSVGYTTATIGKWHLSEDPLPYGFDVNIGGTHSGSPPRGYYPPHPNAPGLEDAPEGEYLTDRLSHEAAKFIEQNAEQPWLLYLTHFSVHTPIQAKQELVAQYEAKTPGKLHDNVAMATMIKSTDDGIGLIMAKLEELSLADDTVILFFSDNGGYGPATDMHPLFGYKGTYYEGGIRVPFAIRWPGRIDAGQSSEALITGVDIYPTLCEIMGAPLPGQILDGKSILPVAQGATPDAERALFWHFPAYLQSYGQTAAEQRDVLFRSRPVSVIRQGDWKLMHFYEDDGYELYNLREDIGERHNLTHMQPGITIRLRNQLQAWLEETQADIPQAKNPEFDEAIHAQAIADRAQRDAR
ncbi:sulfatase [Opitutaceae bacterium]|jgi:arylsulfatase A-like enzyme|nr:sulfatase [Opitutaceae bacterium]